MNNLFNNYIFETFEGEKYNFKKLDNTFIPTATTNYLLKAIIKYKLKEGNTLDLGSGIGILGLLLQKKNMIIGDLFASDLSKDSIESLKENAKIMSCKVEAKVGSLFDPWNNYKFKNIINDVSGISKKVAKLSPWFKNVPCDTGDDGTVLTNKILDTAKIYLEKDGLLFFPIISLSNETRILDNAKSNFKNVFLIEKNNWPLPKEMYKFKNELILMKKEKLIDFEEKFGMIIISTSIYVASN